MGSFLKFFLAAAEQFVAANAGSIEQEIINEIVKLTGNLHVTATVAATGTPPTKAPVTVPVSK
jgi:hypothetical protein